MRIRASSPATGNQSQLGGDLNTAPGPSVFSPPEYLGQQEAVYLNRVLTHTGGDKDEAAEILDVSLATLTGNCPNKTTNRGSTSGQLMAAQSTIASD